MKEENKYDVEILEWLEGVEYDRVFIATSEDMICCNIYITDNDSFQILMKNIEPVIDDLIIIDEIDLDDLSVMLNIMIADFDKYIRNKGLKNLID